MIPNAPVYLVDVAAPYRTPVMDPKPVAPWWVFPFRPIIRLVYPFLGTGQVMRRIHGSKWERRYVEQCCSTMWLRVLHWGNRLPGEGPCVASEEHP